MVAYGDTQGSLAKCLGISVATLNYKLNGRKNGCFTLRELQCIKSRYKLTTAELDAIFFAAQVS